MSDILIPLDALVAVTYPSPVTGVDLLGAARIRLTLGAAATIRKMIERARVRDTIVADRLPDLEPMGWYPPDCLPKRIVAKLADAVASNAPHHWVDTPSDLRAPESPLEGCAGTIKGGEHVFDVLLFADAQGYSWAAQASPTGRGGTPYRRIRTMYLPLSTLPETL